MAETQFTSSTTGVRAAATRDVDPGVDHQYGLAVTGGKRGSSDVIGKGNRL